MTPAPGTSIVAVLDNEPLQALADPAHRKHRAVVRLMEAIAQRQGRRGRAASVVVSTVVRLEAGVVRQAPSSAALGRLGVRDEVLSASRADRAVALRRAAGGAPADAATAQLAEEFARESKVTVYTADLTDLPKLVAALSTSGVRVQLV